MAQVEEKTAQNVIRLGWVSLLNDIGSETIIRLVPFYVSGVLGAPMEIVGAIEGLGEATSTLLKPYFGRLSDRLGRRKAFILFGYSLSSVARPFLALTLTPFGVGAFRVVDRFGKAIRTAPRDSLISISGGGRRQGFRFGINRAMDTIGALIGIGTFAIFLYGRTGGGGGQLQLTSNEWRVLCIASLVPSLFCIAILICGISEVAQSATSAPERSRRRGSPILRKYLFAVTVFGLANSSDAFILLKAKDMGYSLLQTLGMISVLNVFSSMTALPAAMLSDRLGRKTLILAGWLIYAATYTLIGLGFGTKSALAYGTLLGFYGLFFGFTEGVEKAWIADLTPPDDRGRAYGWFGLLTGLTAFPASAVFGWAWDRFGDQVPFLGGAAIACVACLVLLATVPTNAKSSLAK